MFFLHRLYEHKKAAIKVQDHDSGYEIGDDSTEPVRLLKREEFLSYKM